MRRGFWQVVLGIALVLAPIAALAENPATEEAPLPLVARISLEAQSMEVLRDGVLLYQWPVSTARPGKVTPLGTYTAQWLSRFHRSSRYNNAPMPFSIFFHGHYAIHGTDQIGRLGQPASAGCIRLHPDNAEILFEMVSALGPENMQVEITR